MQNKNAFLKQVVTLSYVGFTLVQRVRSAPFNSLCNTLFCPQEALLSVPFMQIISTRILLSDKGRQFLDLKLGNQMVQKVTRLETQEVRFEHTTDK